MTIEFVPTLILKLVSRLCPWKTEIVEIFLAQTLFSNSSQSLAHIVLIGCDSWVEGNGIELSILSNALIDSLLSIRLESETFGVPRTLVAERLGLL